MIARALVFRILVDGMDIGLGLPWRRYGSCFGTIRGKWGLRGGTVSGIGSGWSVGYCGSAGCDCRRWHADGGEQGM